MGLPSTATSFGLFDFPGVNSQGKTREELMATTKACLLFDSRLQRTPAAQARLAVDELQGRYASECVKGDVSPPS